MRRRRYKDSRIRDQVLFETNGKNGKKNKKQHDEIIYVSVETLKVEGL